MSSLVKASPYSIYRLLLQIFFRPPLTNSLKMTTTLELFDQQSYSLDTYDSLNSLDTYDSLNSLDIYDSLKPFLITDEVKLSKLSKFKGKGFCSYYDFCRHNLRRTTSKKIDVSSILDFNMSLEGVTFLHDNYGDEIDYQKLCRHPLLSLEAVKAFPNKKWDFDALSKYYL